MLGNLVNLLFTNRPDQSMMALGDFRFSIRTAAPQEFNRESAWSWSSQPRLGRDPALQYMGSDGETIRLPGVIFPRYRGGFGQIEQMRAMAGGGQPLQLIGGTGELMGRWVIERISERGTYLDGNGRPAKQEFDLTLRKYGEDFA